MERGSGLALPESNHFHQDKIRKLRLVPAPKVEQEAEEVDHEKYFREGFRQTVDWDLEP